MIANYLYTEADLDRVKPSQLKRSYTAYYRVQASSTTPAEAIYAADGVPVTGMSYSGDTAAICTRKSLSRETDDGQCWIVEVTYETPEPGSEDDPNSQQQNQEETTPEGVPVELDVSGSFQAVRQVMEKDADDKKVLNSAGDRFDPPPEEDVFTFQITIARNESAPFDFTKISGYHATLSDTNFAGLDGDKCLLLVSGFQGGVREVQGVKQKYVRVTYTVTYNPLGWKLELLQQGFRARREVGGAASLILVNGVPTPVPLLLDSNGIRYPDSSTNAAYTDFKRFKTVSWSPLNLKV